MNPLSAAWSRLVPIPPSAAWAAAGLALWCGAALAAAPMPLAAHRALYTLSLDKANGSSAPATANGLIAYEFSGSACEGYVSDFRQMTELQPQEGAARVTDMRSTTFEDGDAKGFNFKVESVVDGDQAEEVDGKAEKSADGALAVNLSRPRKVALSFDRNVMFPTEQIIHILDAAHGGQSTLAVKVFDGSDTGDKVHDTLAVIGHVSQEVASEEPAQIDALKGMRHWPVSVSYFSDDQQDGQPNYILSFDLYENGISRALKLDYGDFTLKGELTKLELLPPPAECDK
jgi:hypothetical protein